MGRPPKKVAPEQPTETEVAIIDSPKEVKQEKEENVSENTDDDLQEKKNGPGQLLMLLQPTAAAVRKRGRPRKVVTYVASRDEANYADHAASGESESKYSGSSKKLHADDASNPGSKRQQKESSSSSNNWKPRRREGSCRRKGEPRRAAD